MESLLGLLVPVRRHVMSSLARVVAGVDHSRVTQSQSVFKSLSDQFRPVVTGSYAIPARCFHILAFSPAAMSLGMGMLDTGANLPITNPLLAEMLGMTPADWPQSIPITFGNTALTVSPLNLLNWDLSLAQTTILTKHALH